MAYCGGIELQCAVNKDADLQGKKKVSRKSKWILSGIRQI